MFANPDGIFTPGMFGRIRVPGSPPYTALLIPDAAIGTEQARKYVLVVDDGGVVRQKYVTPGQLDGGLRVIKDGLAGRRPRHRQRPDACAARHQGERRRNAPPQRRQGATTPKPVDDEIENLIRSSRSGASGAPDRDAPPDSRLRG